MLFAGALEWEMQAGGGGLVVDGWIEKQPLAIHLPVSLSSGCSILGFLHRFFFSWPHVALCCILGLH